MKKAVAAEAFVEPGFSPACSASAWAMVRTVAFPPSAGLALAASAAKAVGDWLQPDAGAEAPAS